MLSRIFTSAGIVAIFAPALFAQSKPLDIVKTDTHIEFRSGSQVVAKYQHAGTVQLEKGEGTKPLAKPYFYPLLSPNGTIVTRGWPMIRGTVGETTDHFHQKSAWFCHGDVIPVGLELKTKSADKRVHGVDFWAESGGHGRIVCTKIAIPKNGSIETSNEWRTADGITILEETRTITATETAVGRLFVLDIDLVANAYPIEFGDTKEGALGVRVNDEFRLNGPKSDGVVVSIDGKTSQAPAKDNLPLWGQVAAWHDYSGTANGKVAGIAVLDHPSNVHKAAWHTRAYGLMAANPFGRDGSGFPGVKGNKELVKLAKGEHLKLLYGIYVHDGRTAEGKVAEAFANFSK